MKKRDAAWSAQNAVPVEERAPWRQWIPVALILLAAIVFRIVYLLQYKAQVPYFTSPIVDSYVYDDWARRVVAGEGYGPKPFYMAPLYPYLLALLFKIAGHKLALVYVSQAALGVLNLFLVYILGRRIFGHRAGLIAMVLLMLYAPLAYLETKVLTETLAVTLNLASILLVMRALDRPAGVRFLIAGVVLGLSAVCRPNALITVALIVVWLTMLGWKRIGFGKLFVFQVAPLMIGVALAVLPVTVRNYTVGKGFALLSTNGGIVFAQANNRSANGVSTPLPGFTGSILAQQGEEMAVASKRLGHQVSPSESSSYWFGEGVRYIRENPGGFLWLTARKIIWSLHNREARCSYNPYLEYTLVPILRYLALPFSLLAGLALFGFVSGRVEAVDARTRAYRDLLAVYILSVFLSLIVFSVSSRYRVPAVPAMAAFAGLGVAQAVDQLRKREGRRLVLMAACILPVMSISLVRYPVAPVTSEAIANLGASYLQNGRTNEAIPQLEKALSMDPGFSYAHLILGKALARQGRFEEAVGHYEQVLDKQPENADAHYYLGYALAKLGRPDEAIVHYAEAVRLQPANTEARFNLGVLYDARGKTNEAIREYRAAIGLRADYADAHNNLAIDLYTIGRYAEAWEEVRLCRQYGGTPHPGFIKALEGKMPEPR